MTKDETPQRYLDMSHGDKLNSLKRESSAIMGRIYTGGDKWTQEMLDALSEEEKWIVGMALKLNHLIKDR